MFSTEEWNTPRMILVYSCWLHCPLIVVTNVLVICSIILVKKIHTPHSIIVCSLACSDLLTGIVTLPITVLGNDPHTVYVVKGTKSACYLKLFADHFFPEMSLLYMTALSFDRYIAIVHPIKYRNKCCVKKVIIAVIIVFFIVTVAKTLALSFPDKGKSWKEGLSREENIKRCSAGNLVPKIYQIIFAVVNNVILLISLALSFYVFYVGRKTIKSFTEKADLKRSKYPFLLMKMTLTINCIYFVLWLPYLSMALYINIIHTEEGRLTTTDFSIMWVVSRHCTFINAWINVFVYAIFSKQINRRAYYFFLTRCPWKWSSVNAFLNLEDTKLMMNNSNITNTKGAKFTEKELVKTKNCSFEISKCALIEGFDHQEQNPSNEPNGHETCKLERNISPTGSNPILRHSFESQMNKTP